MNLVKNARISFPAFFCIYIVIICKNFQISSCIDATEDHFLSKKLENLAYFS